MSTKHRGVNPGVGGSLGVPLTHVNGNFCALPLSGHNDRTKPQQIYPDHQSSFMNRLIRALSSGVIAFISVVSSVTYANAGHANLVVDVHSGLVLEAENDRELNYPASLTKMMTLYLTFEALRDGRLKWDDRIVLSENAESKDPYKYAIGAGNSITVEEAVLGMIVISANDAAVGIAEYLAGSEAAFGKLMTDKAHALGMESTVFTNPAGLPDPKQVTTARDMAILGISLMRDFPEEFKLFATKKFKFRGMKLHGHNGPLKHYPGVDGIKTGYTEASGYNIVTSGTKGGKRLIAVVLGGESGQARDEEVSELLDRHLGPKVQN